VTDLPVGGASIPSPLGASLGWDGDELIGHLVPPERQRSRPRSGLGWGGRSCVAGLVRSLTRIPVMTTLSLSEIKARLSEIVDEVERHHERVVLTRNGRPAAVILSPEDLEALEDTLDLLSDPDALAEIRAARREVDAGKAVTSDELRAQYLAT
jgi:prevent-host-death family protein